MRGRICPASPEAWAVFHRKRQRATVTLFIANVNTDMKEFRPTERLAILRGIADALHRTIA